jgi:hypothetical protein
LLSPGRGIRRREGTATERGGDQEGFLRRSSRAPAAKALSINGSPAGSGTTFGGGRRASPASVRVSENPFSVAEASADWLTPSMKFSRFRLVSEARAVLSDVLSGSVSSGNCLPIFSRKAGDVMSSLVSTSAKA